MTQVRSRRSRPPVARRRNNPRGEGARLREDLIDAADAMLSQTGRADQLSIRAIAARAGVAATSFYLHFADLNALKVAVAERAFADLAATRTAAISGIDDPAGALRARCLAYVDFALAHPGQYRLMFGPDLPAPVFTRTYDDAGSAIRTAYEALIDAIRDCQRAGATPDHTDPSRLAALLWPALHGQVTLRLDRPDFDRPPLHDLINQTVQRLIGLHHPVDTPSP